MTGRRRTSQVTAAAIHENRGERTHGHPGCRTPRHDPHRSSRASALRTIDRRRIAALVVGGCYSNPLTGNGLEDELVGIVRQRASVDFPRDSGSIDVASLGGNAYRSTGCDLYRDDQCEYDDASGNSKNAWLYVCRPVANDPQTVATRVDAGLQGSGDAGP
jgi:hypothetical protein